MKIKKTLLSVLCIIVLCMSTFSAYAAGTTFTDVANGKWYTPHISYAVENGIFNGTSATTFSPDTNMTRAQFVQVFANISNVDTSNKNVKTTFTDVPSGKWYTAAVKWAAENGVVNGMGDGTFEPETPVTREQMCVMLVNYVEKFQKETLKSTVDTKTFADDTKIASWAKTSVYKCAKAGLVKGVGNNKFDPQGTTTRAQGATFFSNFHKYVNTSVDNSWFAKKGFEITPLSEELCRNEEVGHVCYGGTDYGIKVKELGDNYKNVYISFPYSCFPFGSDKFIGRVIAFDRNTGAVLTHDCDVFFNYDINGKNVSIKWGGDGVGGEGSWYGTDIICPVDYNSNDVIFVITNEFKQSPWWQDYSTTRTIDEFIDFETAEYYFFSYNNK